MCIKDSSTDIEELKYKCNVLEDDIKALRLCVSSKASLNLKNDIVLSFILILVLSSSAFLVGGFSYLFFLD